MYLLPWNMILISRKVLSEITTRGSGQDNCSDGRAGGQ